MAKGIPLKPSERARIVSAWKNGALTYEEVFFATNFPISTVRLVIDQYLKEKQKPQHIKVSRGLQLTLGI